MDSVNHIMHPDAVQHCPQCSLISAMEPKEEGVPSPAIYYGYLGQIRTGYCVEHGPFELHEYEDLEEQTHMENFMNLILGATMGLIMMGRQQNKESGKQEYWIGLKNHDGTVTIIASMLPGPNEIVCRE